jgi:hypothetical protein
MNTKMLMIKELDQVIQPAISLEEFQAPNPFLAALVAEAIANGTATMDDAEGCPVTATVWEVETWIAWMDGHKDDAVEFDVPYESPHQFDVAQAGADALGVDVCEELNVQRKGW